MDYWVMPDYIIDIKLIQICKPTQQMLLLTQSCISFLTFLNLSLFIAQKHISKRELIHGTTNGKVKSFENHKMKITK